MKRAAITGRYLYWFLSFLLVLLSLRWFPRGVEIGIPSVAYQFERYPLALYVHMVGSTVPMALIPFQINTRFRLSRPGLHRVLGRVSVAGVFFGGLALFPLALNMDIPAWGKVGFVFGGLLWIATAAIGLIHVWLGDIARHRWWMMITATVIFGAVTLRLVFPIYRGLGIPFDISYSLAGWSAWIINLGLFFGWQYRARIRAGFSDRAAATGQPAGK